MKITPMLDSDQVRVELDYDSPGGRVAFINLSSAEARAIAMDLVEAANIVRYHEGKPDLSGVHDSDCTKYGCEGHQTHVTPQVSVSIDMDEVNRQFENALREAKKLGWNKRKQQEHERDKEKRLSSTVREKPGRFINVDLGPAEVVAAAPMLKCAKCGKDQHSGWCWL